MKKKNKIYAFVAVLAATLTMLFANSTEVKAAEHPTEHPYALVTKGCLDYNSYEELEDVKVYYLKNSHGDIIGQVDENGKLLVSYSYNAFGELVAVVTFTPETANNRFLYVGEQYDEASGLYYLRARHYDAGAGRFTQEDTYLGDGRNLYAYTHSNPLKYIDPSGHATTQVILDNDGDLIDDTRERREEGVGYSSGADYIVTTNGVVMATNQNYNLVSTAMPTNQGGSFIQIHNTHTHAGISPHTHTQQVNVNPVTGQTSAIRITYPTTAADIDNANSALLNETMRVRASRVDLGGN